MNLPLPLHPSRQKVLYALRHAPSRRYTDLMRVTELESDVFKFHIRTLVESGLVSKNPDGAYTLTATGKEFANNIDATTGRRNVSPKLSILFMVRRRHGNEWQYIVQQRQRNPFFGYWGLLSAPVLWGRSIKECADAEFLKQTGLSASFRVRGFCRVRDYLKTDRTLLEDKLFTIVEAELLNGEPVEWHGGNSKWMTADELRDQKKVFSITPELIRQSDAYFEIENLYNPSDY